MRRVVVDPLKVAVRLVLHLPRQGPLRVGEQGGNVAAANLLDGVVGDQGYWSSVETLLTHGRCSNNTWQNSTVRLGGHAAT